MHLSTEVAEKPSRHYDVALISWAAGWTVGAVLLLIANITADLSVPHTAAVDALVVGLPTVAAPTYVSAQRFGGRPVIEATIWVACFVAMWFVYAWVNQPPALNINTTESMRARAEYLRHPRLPIEAVKFLWAIGAFGVVAAFGSALCNRSPKGPASTALQAVIFSAIVEASLMMAVGLFMVSASIFVLVAPAVARADAGLGISLGRRSLWAGAAGEAL